MVDGRTTDNGACLYYKLINEPKGSVELKRFPLVHCYKHEIYLYQIATGRTKTVTDAITIARYMI